MKKIILLIIVVVMVCVVEDVKAGQTFSTSSIVTIALAPLDNDTFVIGYIDGTNLDVQFIVYDTNGVNITTNISVDNSIGDAGFNNQVGVSPFNSTSFVIGWVNRGQQDVRFAVYSIDDSIVTLTSGPTNVETSSGSSLSVSVSTFNSTSFVIGWTDAPERRMKFSIYDSSSTLTAGPVTTDNSISAGSGAVSVSTFNESSFVMGWWDSESSKATTFGIYDSSGALTSGPIIADIPAGIDSYSVSVSTFNESSFVIGWYDHTDEDVTFSIYDSNGTLSSGPTDANTTIGVTSQSTSVAILNESAFVIGWYDSSDTSIMTNVYDSSSNSLSNQLRVNDSGRRGLSVASEHQAVNIELCNDIFIIAYSSSVTHAAWQSYYPNGTVWNGICETSPPTISGLNTNATNATTSGETVNLSAICDDETAAGQIWWSLYNQTDYENGTSVDYIDNVIYTFNLTISEAKGVDVNLSIYCDDTYGNLAQSLWIGFTVNNTPPKNNFSVSIKSPANENDDLNGTITDYFDIDKDTWTANETRWFTNDKVNTTYDDQTNISKEFTQTGEKWIFMARVYDGTDWSDWINSSEITIGDDTPPTVVDSSISPISVTIGTSVDIILNLTDVGSSIGTVKVEVEDVNNLKTNFTMSFVSGTNDVGENTGWKKTYTGLNTGTYYTKYYFSDTSGNPANSSVREDTFTVTAIPTPPAPSVGGGGAAPTVISNETSLIDFSTTNLIFTVLSAPVITRKQLLIKNIGSKTFKGDLEVSENLQPVLTAQVCDISLIVCGVENIEIKDGESAIMVIDLNVDPTIGEGRQGIIKMIDDNDDVFELPVSIDRVPGYKIQRWIVDNINVDEQLALVIFVIVSISALAGAALLAHLGGVF